MLATCRGGIVVASKTCSVLLAASDDPDFLLVRRQADAVARAAVPLDRPLLVALHLDPMELLARGQVAHLEAEQAVDVHEAEGLRAR